MAALDVHVAVLPQTPAEWVARCLSSVEAAASRAPFPVHVHVVDGVPGHVGKARERGYACGSAPFVTYVDDDDEVLPEGFAMLPLERNPAAVFTAEVIDNGRGRWVARRRHNLSVYRRDVLAGVDFAAWPYAIDAHCRQVAGRHPDVIDLPEPACIWRMRTDSPARRLADSEEMARALHG